MRDNRSGRVLRHVYPAPSKFAALDRDARTARPGAPPWEPCPPALPAGRCRSGFPCDTHYI